MAIGARSALFVTTVPVTLEVFLAPFARHFRSLGWRVDALANGAEAATALEADFDHRFDAPWTRALSLGNLGAARRIREIVEAGGYDIVHVHTPVAAFVTRYALHRRRGPRPVVIYTAHGFHFYRGQRFLSHALFRTLERLAAPWTDYLVTINAEDFTAACALGGIQRSRIRLIPGIGVDLARFAEGAVEDERVRAVREEFGIPDGAFVLAMIAEFTAVKRHRLVLEALSLVRERPVVTVFVGEGPLQARARAEATRLGLDASVRFAGYRRDVPALLAASDALVLASKREGLPRSAMEAMAAGRPVIGTPTRGITDVVAERAGWIAADHSAAALARAIEDASSDPVEARRRGEAARERASVLYALPSIVDAYARLYEEALGAEV